MPVSRPKSVYNLPPLPKKESNEVTDLFHIHSYQKSFKLPPFPQKSPSTDQGSVLVVPPTLPKKPYAPNTPEMTPKPQNEFETSVVALNVITNEERQKFTRIFHSIDSKLNGFLTGSNLVHFSNNSKEPMRRISFQGVDYLNKY